MISYGFVSIVNSKSRYYLIKHKKKLVDVIPNAKYAYSTRICKFNAIINFSRKIDNKKNFRQYYQ